MPTLELDLQPETVDRLARLLWLKLDHGAYTLNAWNAVDPERRAEFQEAARMCLEIGFTTAMMTLEAVVHGNSEVNTTTPEDKQDDG